MWMSVYHSTNSRLNYFQELLSKFQELLLHQKDHALNYNKNFHLQKAKPPGLDKLEWIMKQTSCLLHH